MKLPVLSQEPLVGVDMTPDPKLALRIIEAYLENCNCRWSGDANPIYTLMNQHQEERKKILERARQVLMKDWSDQVVACVFTPLAGKAGDGVEPVPTTVPEISPIKQRMVIAEFIGRFTFKIDEVEQRITVLDGGQFRCDGRLDQIEAVLTLAQVPDYPHDLHAMAGAEEKLTREQQTVYMDHLLNEESELGDMLRQLTFAPASSRASAFVKTICPPPPAKVSDGVEPVPTTKI